MTTDTDTLVARLVTQPPCQAHNLEAADRIKALETQLSDWKASQHYRYIGADGKPVLARELEARIITLESQLEAALDIVQGIEIMTATGEGLTPEETAALHWLAAAGRADPPITMPALFSELVKAQEAIVRITLERDEARAGEDELAEKARAMILALTIDDEEGLVLFVEPVADLNAALASHDKRKEGRT
ncbi:hypothetical protein HOY34_17210 [Xinfangfangia sp. D13-10-4-6]|uniref:hypothetical protein n=1 Tax=Pseudogemmobacter hezensis TaxID=2737662 RepID=UPI001557BAEC|nr:hypothetical protein [Pseudogemmobacter hezensis]NPD16934.1 hypothetical protein [Pseudogemmobacter hezensis]